MNGRGDERHLRAVENTGDAENVEPGATEERTAISAAAGDPFSGPEAPELALLSGQQKRELRRAKRAALWVGVILPLVLVAAAIAVILVWLPRLPDPAAVHWSGGEPDGFEGHVVVLLTYAGLGGGMALLFGLLGLFGAGQGSLGVWTAMNRIMAAASPAIVSVIMLTGVLSLWMQLDLADARDAPDVSGSMGIGFGVGFAVGIVAFFLQPGVRISAPTPDDAAPLELRETERAVWTARVGPSRPFFWTLVLVYGVVGSSIVWSFAIGTPIWMLNAAILVLMVVLHVTTASFRVRVDETGIEARSTLGRPRFRVPADDIERVVASQIQPLGDFGGWGLRFGPGRFGIVMRTGPGIVVTRRDGRIWAVTVDDAETGAALLASVARRAGPESEYETEGETER